MIITFYQDVVINAGSDRVVCEDSAITINDASLTSPAPAVEAQYPVTYLWTIVSGEQYWIIIQ